MNTEPRVEKLKPLLAALKVGSPASHDRLTLIPLYGNGEPSLDYVLGAEAIETGGLEVTEVDEQGHVPELLVVSTLDKQVLLLDGEELVGAKQHRILNTTVMLPAKSKTKIPVSCVEAGRWSYRHRTFRPGGYSSSSLRAAKSRSVSRNLQETGYAGSDQAEVWDHVEKHLSELGTSSGTRALHDAIEQHHDTIEEYTKDLGYPPGSRGVVVALGGKFRGMDLFDRPVTLGRAWSRLLSGYVLDAMAWPESETSSFSPRDAAAVLEKVGQAECQPCPSVGVGEDWRFGTLEVVGQALVAEGVCVHACAFHV